MKITSAQLRQIINEEVKSALFEGLEHALEADKIVGDFLRNLPEEQKKSALFALQDAVSKKLSQILNQERKAPGRTTIFNIR